MNRSHLTLVPPRPPPAPPPAELPEVLLVRRLDDVRDAWLVLTVAWFVPGSWFALYGALDRYEGQRLRMRRGR